MASRGLRERYGPWAVVTGASSGIGEEFARQLAAAGLDLVLVARRGERLRSLAAELERDQGVHTRVAAADLTRPEFIDALRPSLGDIEVGLLINNAGATVGGAFADHDLELQRRTGRAQRARAARPDPRAGGADAPPRPRRDHLRLVAVRAPGRSQLRQLRGDEESQPDLRRGPRA